MIIIHNRFIPFGKKYLAINLLGIVFTKGTLSPVQRNHEYIHTKQQQELLFVFFYILYVLEWIVRIFQYRNMFKAYRNISFEREAYDKMNNPDYVLHRSYYAWVSYLNLKLSTTKDTIL